MSALASTPNSSHSLEHFGWQAPSSMPMSTGALAPSATSTASSSGWKNAVTLQQLSGFSMRNLSAYGAASGALMDVYFKLGAWRSVYAV